MKMKIRMGLLAAALALPGAAQSEPVIDIAKAPAQPARGAEFIPVYGKDNPGSPADEIVTSFMGRETVIRNITYPTLTPVFPRKGKANGTAVIVAAGGGFAMLSLQNEGWRTANAPSAGQTRTASIRPARSGKLASSSNGAVSIGRSSQTPIAANAARPAPMGGR